MKRFLGLALALLSIGTVGLAVELKANEASTNSLATTEIANGQWQRDRYGRRIYNNRRRVVRRTRVVRVGKRLYRETFVVRYLPNGRVDTRLISRVRIS